MITVQKMNSVMVVAAHPDDEILGCGGTMARLVQQGARVTVVLLGEGPVSRLETENSHQKATEQSHAFASAHRAGAILGVDRVITPADRGCAGFPDNRFDTVPLIELVKYIEAIGAEIKPDVVFTHHAGDLNVDHRITHQAVLTAFRPLPGQTVRSVFAFEILSSTEYSFASAEPLFVPNFFVDIATALCRKQEALHAYSSEMRDWPHPRSYEGVECLAKLRGAQNGVDAAEAFIMCRGLL